MLLGDEWRHDVLSHSCHCFLCLGPSSDKIGQDFLCCGANGISCPLFLTFRWHCSWRHQVQWCCPFVLVLEVGDDPWIQEYGKWGRPFCSWCGELSPWPLLPRTWPLWLFVLTGYEKMSACPAACLWFWEVQCIAVIRKDHVTCVLHDDCIRMSRGIVQKFLDLFHCVLSQVCLLCSERKQCHEHSAVNTSCIIKESANDLLDDFLSSLWSRFDMSVSSPYCTFAP